MDNAPTNDQIPTNDVVENQDEDISKVEPAGETEEEKVEPAVGAEEEIQPANNAAIAAENVDNTGVTAEKVEEKAQPVNNEADKEKTEEKTEEKVEEKVEENVEEKTPEKPFAKLDEKVNEKSFDFDKGFKTKEEAIKQAEALVKNSKINKGYNISMGADGRYYIQLTPEETKTEGVERKPIEKAKLEKVEEKGKGKAQPTTSKSNVQTGVAGIGGILAILASAIAIFKKTKH